MRTCLIAVAGTLLGASTLLAADSPTFYKDVLPILQANCQSCHRPGEVAPMSLITFVVKTNFPEDMWVTAAEMRAGNPKVLHHGKVWVRPPGSTWMQKAVPGEAYDRETASHREIMGNNAIEEGQRHHREVQPGSRCAAFRHGRRGQVRPEGIRSRLRAALHDSRRTDDRRLEARSRAGERAAAAAILLPRGPTGRKSLLLIGNRFWPSGALARSLKPKACVSMGAE